MSTPRLVVFLVGVVCIAMLSLPALRAGWKHAVPRSLAFLSVFGVLLMNFDAWVADAWSVRQLLSWILLLSSAILALHAFYVLHKYGRPQGSIDFTTTLVTTGIYRLVRHPLYASLLYLAWGALLKRVAPAQLAFAAAATLLLYITARQEEVFNASKFGPSYEEYMRTTKMFVPYLV
jgi:protein-S-isoprenylcysteine O-methyltransferase Ste14